MIIFAYHITDTNITGTITITPYESFQGDPLIRDPNIHYMYVSPYMVIPLPGILTYTKCMLVQL